MRKNFQRNLISRNFFKMKQTFSNYIIHAQVGGRQGGAKFLAVRGGRKFFRQFGGRRRIFGSKRGGKKDSP